MLEELMKSIKSVDVKLEELRGYFDLAHNEERARELETELNDPDIWKNQPRADSLSRELRAIRSLIGPYKEIEEQYVSIRELSEMIEAGDEDSINTIHVEVEDVKGKIDRLEFKCLLGGELDRCNAILSINSGAGGTESCDWASMLFRMYTRWAENHGHVIEIYDQLQGEEAGIKNVTMLVKGDLAYGYLKGESGVHRLVRISPFDSNKRRHTSFASIDVIPDIDKEINVEINENDLRIDTYRSSGAGGQHVNVTDSAVRITHLPTGIVVQCQKERSQHKNKATAMKILKAKLYEKERRERENEAMRHHGEKKKIEWGSQIRSYVLHPYKMVKDHRTGEQTSNAERTLDGDIDMFSEAYLRYMAAQNKN
ncbi:MAG: peptide chain release factor 2 [Candidatus Omnitrophica bacterium]|nr:peptide chain release factor 2 [Candidatus Omnitrophota bacterium]MDD5488442.1 peptide chain release factor 2 [Candidatus Omnitrophota bacterium]